MKAKTFFILFFSVILILIILTPQFMTNTGGSYGKGYVSEVNFNKSVSCINQILQRYSNTGKAIDYTNVNNFAKLLADSFYGIENIKNTDENNKFSRYEIVKYKLSDYQNMPVINSIEGYSVMFLKFEEGCKVVDTVNIENSNCIIDIDLNTYKNPYNTKKYTLGSYTDRFSFIIDGHNNSIVIPQIYSTYPHNKFSSKNNIN